MRGRCLRRMSRVNRLAAWPNHRLSLGMGASQAGMAGISASNGDFGLTFWGLVTLAAFWVAIARRERRRGGLTIRRDRTA